MAEPTHEELLLIRLKADLEILHNAKDTYLRNLIETAQEEIEGVGVPLTGSSSNDNLVVMYAAWLYRKRATSDDKMPRMLQYHLHNAIIRKAGEDNVT